MIKGGGAEWGVTVTCPPLQMQTWVNIFTIRRPGHNGDDDVFLIFLPFGNRINRDGDIDEDDDVIVTQAPIKGTLQRRATQAWQDSATASSCQSLLSRLRDLTSCRLGFETNIC